MDEAQNVSKRPDYEQMWRDCHARNSILWQELNGWEGRTIACEIALREVRDMMMEEPLTRTNKALKVVRRIDLALHPEPVA